MARYQFSPADVAEQIAAALSAMNDYAPVSKDQVIVEPTEYAGRYLITIYDSPQAANAVIPLLDEHGAIPIATNDLSGCVIGYKTNRKPLAMNLRQHGVAIGGTTSGKTSLLRGMLLHALRCPTCFIWIGGTWKLYKFVAPCVDPFLDTGFPPPIDWIAHGHQDVANMLAAFLDVGEYRMSLREDQLARLPTGFLILDEVTYIVQDKSVRGVRNGKGHRIDALLSDVVRGSAEADLWTWLATQHDTQFNLGDDGGTVGAQMMFKFIFAIGDYQSAGRVTNDFSLSLPTHPGECWVRPALTAPLYKIRVPYPRKGVQDTVHNGPTMADMVWNRRHIPHRLDEGSAQAAGEHYANRHGPVVSDNYIRYLVTRPDSSSASTVNGVGTPSADAADFNFSKEELAEAEERFYAMMHEQAEGGSGEQASTNGHASAGALDEVTSLRNLKAQNGMTREDRVRTVVAANESEGGEPMTRGEIIEALGDGFGDQVPNPQVVTNILLRLASTDPPVIAKTIDGRYHSA